MTPSDAEFNLELSRRKLLTAAGIGGAAVAASLIRTGAAEAEAPSPLSLRSGDGASGRRIASAVRRGCFVGDGGVLARAATGSKSPCRARRPRWQARANRRCQRNQLHRCQVRPGRLRLSCQARSIAGRLHLSVRRHARRRRRGIRYVPHLAAWPCAVHLHQFRRPGHADPGQEIRAARRRADAESALCE